MFLCAWVRMKACDECVVRGVNDGTRLAKIHPMWAKRIDVLVASNIGTLDLISWPEPTVRLTVFIFLNVVVLVMWCSQSNTGFLSSHPCKFRHIISTISFNAMNVHLHLSNMWPPLLFFFRSPAHTHVFHHCFQLTFAQAMC